MKKTLERLFEYQKFSKNQDLEKMILEAEEKATVQIPDTELGFVTGGRSMPENKEEKEEKK